MRPERSTTRNRGSHFFYPPTAGGKVDKSRPTQVGRAMQEVGIQTIAAYSPEARGRSERNFGTWQNRRPQELRLARIISREGANRFLRERYIAKFNQKFAVAAEERGTAFRAGSRADNGFCPRQGKSQTQNQQGGGRTAAAL